MKVKAWRFPWYAVLVGVIPPLFVWSGSPAEVDPKNVLPHVILGVVLSGAALALFRRFLEVGRSGLAASLVVVGLTWPLDPVLALLLPFLGVPLLFLLKRSPDKPGLSSVTVFLNGLAITTVGTSLVAVLLSVTPGNPAMRPRERIRLRQESRPDIWWIVLDGLSRGDWLKKRFGVEDVLGPGLSKRGFQVARAARSNYPQTLYVITSTLNLDYVHAVAERAEVPREVAKAFLGANRVAASLSSSGYRTVYWPGGYHRLDPGLDETRTASFLPTEYHLALMNQWPPTGIWRMATGRSLSAAIRHEFIVKTMESVRGVPDGPPTFNFLHVVAPHPPFVVGANGELDPTGTADTIMDGSFWNEANPGVSFRKGYSAQASWVQRRVLEAVDRILARGARPAVIVVCSDHGSGLDFDWKRLSRAALFDRMSAFYAVYLPDVPSRPIPATMSTVNTFRYVFDEVFGTSLGLLPDRSYWQTWDRPDRLTDVTGMVHGPD
jgi:hypothetical protein